VAKSGKNHQNCDPNIDLKVILILRLKLLCNIEPKWYYYILYLAFPDEIFPGSVWGAYMQVILHGIF
jgi:hypothetical protein